MQSQLPVCCEPNDQISRPHPFFASRCIEDSELTKLLQPIASVGGCSYCKHSGLGVGIEKLASEIAPLLRRVLQTGAVVYAGSACGHASRTRETCFNRERLAGYDALERQRKE